VALCVALRRQKHAQEGQQPRWLEVTAKVLPCSVAGLEKDIAGLKREIRERDETIGDKERRIYELKKKNQELEKFKFVLDYKIKELKKQVGCPWFFWTGTACLLAWPKQLHHLTSAFSQTQSCNASLLVSDYSSCCVQHSAGGLSCSTFLVCVLQIEPREVEINEMRETIRAMDAELERYHKSNAGLDMTIQV
jgi:hypothetical protein